MLTARSAAHSTSDLQRLDTAHIVHPHQVVGHPANPIVVERAQGSTLWDTDGREYLDATCGLWQNAIGHGRDELVRVAADQMGAARVLRVFLGLLERAGDPPRGPARRAGRRRSRSCALHERGLRRQRARDQARSPRVGPCRATRPRHHPQPRRCLPRVRRGGLPCRHRAPGAQGRLRSARPRLRAPEPRSCAPRRDRRTDRRARPDDRASRRRPDRRLHRRADHGRGRRHPCRRTTIGRAWRPCSASTTSSSSSTR